MTLSASTVFAAQSQLSSIGVSTTPNYVGGAIASISLTDSTGQLVGTLVPGPAFPRV